MEKNNNQNQKITFGSEFGEIPSVTELLNVCKDQEVSSYKNIDSKTFGYIIFALIENLRKTKVEEDKKGIVQAMQNIINTAPPEILSSEKISDLLKSLKDNCIDNIVLDGKRVGELLVGQNTKSINFGTYLMFISYCKDNSVPSDIFDRTVNIMINDTKNFIRASYLIFKGNVSSYKTSGYYKCMFTPSLINFLKSKFKFEKGYNLEHDLKKKFEEENFVEGANCDLSIILYRLCYESYISIPHKKEDIVKLFETTKSVLPEDYKQGDHGTVRIRFYSTLLSAVAKKFCSEMDKCVEEIFKKKGTLTLEDLKILNFSRFHFAKDSNTKGTTKEEFLTLIPNEIDDKYYFRWLIEFYFIQIYSYDQDYFISLINRYKFKDAFDFTNFCTYMEIREKQGTMTNSKVARAILNACSNIKSQLSNSIIFQDLQEVVKEADGENKTNNGTNSNLIVSGTYNANINFGQNDLTNLQTQNENIRTNNNSSWFGYVLLTLMFIGIVLLTIITLGGIFWGPWLFKKIFGNCCNFEGGNVIDGDNENLKDLNQSSIPRQDNNPEENLNNRVIGDDDKNGKNLNQSPIPTQDNNPERKFRY